MPTSLFRPSSHRFALPWLLALPLACHHGSSDAAPPLEVEVTNLRLAVREVEGEGDLWLLEVEEAAQGSTDLNQDGDTDDRVVFAYDSRGTAPRNLGLASPTPGLTKFFVDGDLGAFAVGEAANGRDLNGDGDALDRVLHVYDARTGTTQNLALALAPNQVFTALVGAHCVIFSVSELAQDTDLDGDGLTDGHVAHIHDATTGVTWNTGLQRMNHWQDMAESNGSLAFGVTESAASGDLNGDGDALDPSVVHVYDAATGVIANSGLALALERQWTQLAMADGVWGILVSEEAQGAFDVNGDGDLGDFHLHTFEPGSGSAHPLGVEIGLGLGAHGGNFVVALSGAAFWVPALVAARSGALTVVGRPFDYRDPPFVRCDENVVFPAFEGPEDFNGDGDLSDELLQALDPKRMEVRILAVQFLSFDAAGQFLALDRAENLAGLDWNGDGDLFDRQLFFYDARSDREHQTGLANASLEDMDETRGLVLLDEDWTHADINGDGDQNDHVFALYEWASRRHVKLSLTGLPGRPQPHGVRFPGSIHRLAPGDRALLFVDEAGQGADLNGDGDLDDDWVLHQLAPASGTGAPPGPAR